jgi:hypothetical protein
MRACRGLWLGAALAWSPSTGWAAYGRGQQAPEQEVRPGLALTMRMSTRGSTGRVAFTLPPGFPVRGTPHGSLTGTSYVLDLAGAGEIFLAAAADVSGVGPPEIRSGILRGSPAPGALGAGPLGTAAKHVQAVQGGHDRIVLTLEPGSIPRVWRDHRRIVVDVAGVAAPAQGKKASADGASATLTLAGKPPVIATRLAQRHGAAPAAVSQAEAPAPPGHSPPPGLATAPAAAQVVAGPKGQSVAQGPALGQTAIPTPLAPAIPPQAPPMLAPDDDADARAVSPATPDTGSAALRAFRVAGEGDAILLPFEPHVGAAAFALGGLGHVVFDDAKAIDLAALKADPVFGTGRIMLLPGSTHLTMVMPAGARLALHRKPDGWIVAVEHGRLDRDVAQVRLQHGVLLIANTQAADTLVLVDPATGAKLLVGTVHDHAGPVQVPHVSPEFSLLPSWEGVVLLAVSDRLTLAPEKQGFALHTASGLPMVTVMPDSGQMALESAGALTRHFDLPVLPVKELLQRLTADVTAAARAPKQARFEPRLHAAKDMLALGLDREAAALLQAARNDDPSQDGRPETGALLAMARWLVAGEAAKAEAGDPGLASLALGNSDEVALWRALMPAPGATIAERAAVLAADWRLLTSYPLPLRHRLLPLAASILIDGNQLKAATDLLADADDPGAATVRARLLQAQGRVAEAIVALDKVAAGIDRKQAAAAGRAAIELRLQTRKIDPATAAKALQKQLYAWREPEFEIDGMLRIADLLLQAGDFRGALGELREVDRLFADSHDRVKAAEQRTVHALVQAGGGSALSPLDLVALVDENADLLGQGDVASSLTPVLVEKLVALDLPERANKLVAKLIERTADAEPKAALGARMASLRLDQGDAAGALSALDQTSAADLSQPLDSKRAVLRASALVQLGETAPALSVLATHDGDASWEMQAQIMEKSKDWHGAEGALQKLVQSRVPVNGALSDEQQDLVLRLASAATQAGDGATLTALQSGAAQRLSSGPRAALFQALTAQPVQGVADLPRSGREAEAARALPAAIASYEAH